MKKYLILILFISSSVLSFGQIDNYSESEVLSILCSGKWYMEYTILNGEKELVPNGEVDWIIFYENGVHFYTDLGVYLKGTWKYDHDKKAIITDDDAGTVEHFITKLSKTVLEVKEEYNGGSWIMAFNKVERK